MRRLSRCVGNTLRDRIQNENIEMNVGVANIKDKIRETCETSTTWYTNKGDFRIIEIREKVGISQWWLCYPIVLAWTDT